MTQNSHDNERALIAWVRRAHSTRLHEAYGRTGRTWIRILILRELARRAKRAALVGGDVELGRTAFRTTYDRNGS